MLKSLTVSYDDIECWLDFYVWIKIGRQIKRTANLTFIEIDLVLHLYSSSASNSHEKTNQKKIRDLFKVKLYTIKSSNLKKEKERDCWLTEIKIKYQKFDWRLNFDWPTRFADWLSLTYWHTKSDWLSYKVYNKINNS